jgi:hypothetical protein
MPPSGISEEMMAMKSVRYKISIHGLTTPNGKISFSKLKAIAETFCEGAERALRLAIEGQSIKKGPAPAWLSNSTDFILAGISKGSTTLVIDAPILDEAARHQIRQMDLWHTPPQARDTALTVLSQSLHDASSEKLESERYDTGVLDALLNFKQLLRDNGLSIRLISDKRPDENFVLDNAALNAIQKVKQATPEPQAVLVSGVLDSIVHSKKRFQLTMKNRLSVQGKIDESAVPVERLRKLWGQQVTIKGIIHFKASGKPRFLEAQMIEASQAGDGIFETLKPSQTPAQIWANVKSEISERNVFAEIWGKWPGDESIEEILAALQQNRAAN